MHALPPSQARRGVRPPARHAAPPARSARASSSTQSGATAVDRSVERRTSATAPTAPTANRRPATRSAAARGRPGPVTVGVRARPAQRHRARPPRRRGRRLVVLLALSITAVALVTRGSGGAPAQPAAATQHREHQKTGVPANPAAATRAQQRAAVERLVAAGGPVYCGGGTKPLVALTFDDGPGPYTRHTLSVLRDHNARGTFFLVAKEVVGW